MKPILIGLLAAICFAGAAAAQTAQYGTLPRGQLQDELARACAPRPLWLPSAAARCLDYGYRSGIANGMWRAPYHDMPPR